MKYVGQWVHEWNFILLCIVYICLRVVYVGGINNDYKIHQINWVIHRCSILSVSFTSQLTTVESSGNPHH